MAKSRRRSRAERRTRNEKVRHERRNDNNEPLLISSTKNGHDLVITLENIAVAENSFTIEDHFSHVFNPHSIDRVIFDLAKVPFMDSTSLGLLVDLKKKVNNAGAHFFITNPSPQVRWLIDTLRLNHILAVV